MEVVAIDLERGHLSIRDLQALRIRALVDLGSHLQPALGRGGRDQLDDHLVAYERTPPPVHPDMREEPMLDLVPLAGPGRQVADVKGQTCLVGEVLQRRLPEPYARAVAAAPIGHDE